MESGDDSNSVIHQDVGFDSEGGISVYIVTNAKLTYQERQIFSSFITRTIVLFPYYLAEDVGCSR